MKVLVADDELPIRSWMEFALKKTNYSFERLDLVSNGKQALEAFYNNFYDVVFTDIRMPIMDGLELSRIIKEKYPETVIIILTAYSDFELARNASAIKADKYILKTEIDEQTLADIIANIHPSKRLQLEIKDNIHHLQKAATLQQVADGKIAGREKISEALVKSGTKLSDEGLFSLAVSFEDEYNYELLNRKLEEQSKGSLTNILLFNHKSILFVAGNTGGKDPAQRQTYLREIAENLASSFHINIGLSKIHNDIGELPTALLESESALNQRFYHPGKKILFFEKHTNRTLSEEYRLTAISELYKNIKSKNFNEAKAVIDEIFKKVQTEEFSDIQSVKKVCTDILAAYNRDNNIDQNAYSMITDINCWQELRNYVLDIISGVTSASIVSIEKTSRYIRMAIEYTESHYPNIEGITDITDVLFINPEYFSRLFKKETGLTYSTYLNDLRLMKAAELLLNSNMKVYQIAQQVGYSNVGYFCRIFKKKYEISPFEYRNKTH